MAEADFDDNDEWFHDGIDDKPIIQDMNIEVREEQRQLVKWYKFDGSLIQLMFNNFKLFPVFVFILLIFSTVDVWPQLFKAVSIELISIHQIIYFDSTYLLDSDLSSGHIVLTYPPF